LSASQHTGPEPAGGKLMDTSTRLPVTFFRNYAATTKRQEMWSLDALGRHIASTTAIEKDRLPWLKLATFGDIRNKPQGLGKDGKPIPIEAWSLRHDANVLSVTGIEADYDAEQMSFDEAVEIATSQGILSIVYTSPSHTEDKQRWRILCPLGNAVEPAARSKMMGRLNGLYRGIFSGESWTLSQSYYFGSVASNPSHRVEVIDGAPLDQHEDLDEIWAGKPNTTAKVGTSSAQQSGPLNEAELLEQIIRGDSYHAAYIRLLGRWAFDGVSMIDARQKVVDAMESVFPPDRDARWKTRFDDIDRCIFYVFGKEATKRDSGTESSRRRLDQNDKDQPVYAPLRTVNPIQYWGKPVPQRRWIVDRWLPIPSVTLLYADGGVGKTQVAQQLMTSCATGKPWLGLRVEPCRSFALFCEDDEDELHRRQAAINIQYNLRFDELEAMRWASGTGEDNVLVRFEPNGRAIMTERFEDLIKQTKDHGARLLIIDTAADTFGGNENDRGQVRQYIGNALSRAAREIDGAVLVNAHPSRTGLSTGNLDGGSTGWNNSARSRWSLQRPVDEDGNEVLGSDERILTRRKANYASVGDTIRLQWIDGVMVSTDSGASPYTALARRAQCEGLFLDMLDRAEAQGRPVSQSLNAGNFAPKVFSKAPDRQGFSKRDFESAMEVLLAAGQLVVVPYGSASRGTVKLVRTTQTDPDECPSDA
jgi:RecA-family ATPase